VRKTVPVARLILIRHGESVANRERRFSLDDEEPLTPEGVEQARATAERLVGRFRPVALFSSPLARAFATAREIGGPFGLDPSPIAELREQSFGALRGAPYERFYDIHGQSLQRSDFWQLRPEGGETLVEVASRVGPVLDRLAHSHHGHDVVVVSHGGVMAALRAHIRGHFDEPPEPTPNAGGYRVEAELVEDALVYRGPLSLFDESGTD
jgi:broad specificity phosphatase PhoE